jgi:hypothetical protein
VAKKKGGQVIARSKFIPTAKYIQQTQNKIRKHEKITCRRHLQKSAQIQLQNYKIRIIQKTNLKNVSPNRFAHSHKIILFL